MLATWNHSLFLAINAPAGLSGFSLHLSVFLAKDLAYSVWFILAGLWLWGGQARRQVVLLACVAVGLGIIINTIIGHLWFQPRPFVLGLGQQYLAHKPNYSFPSDHATLLATLSFILLWFHGTRIAAIILVLITLCVSWARVYVGVHFPLDVLGAYVLSVIYVLIVLACQRPISQYLFPPLDRIYRKIFALPIQRAWVQG